MAAVLFDFHCVVVVAQTIKGTEESVLGVEQEEQGVEHGKGKQIRNRTSVTKQTRTTLSPLILSKSAKPTSIQPVCPACV